MVAKSLFVCFVGKAGALRASLCAAFGYLFRDLKGFRFVWLKSGCKYVVILILRGVELVFIACLTLSIKLGYFFVLVVSMKHFYDLSRGLI